MTTREQLLHQLDEAARAVQSARTEAERANRPSHLYEVRVHLVNALADLHGARIALDQLDGVHEVHGQVTPTT